MMKIIEPSVELWRQGSNPEAHIAHCARVCYAKDVGDDRKLCSQLRKNGHWSMFRHESVYAITKEPDFNEAIMVLHEYEKCPYIQIKQCGTNYYIATNGHFMLDHRLEGIAELINRNKVSWQVFDHTKIGHSMMRYTFSIVTQISTSRELDRMSPNNISEQSTRYVDLREGVIVRPHWINKQIADIWNRNMLTYSTPEAAYLSAVDYGLNEYTFLVENDVKRQDARGVLPLDTATHVVYTYSVDEWKHLIELRTGKRAHPNCQIIAGLVKEQLKNLGYDFG